jgi:hypothetical protein
VLGPRVGAFWGRMTSGESSESRVHLVRKIRGICILRRKPQKPSTRARARAISGAALALLAVLAATFLPAGGAQAIPNVFSFDMLRGGDAQGLENYTYTAGDVIFPQAGVDPGTY